VGELLRDIIQSTWFGALGFLLTVFFGILSIVLYRRGKKEKRPRYCTHGPNLFWDLTKHVDGIKVHFPGHSDPIPSLTITKLLFWNDGKDTIDYKRDVSRVEPIRIVCRREGVEILQADIIQANQPANMFSETVSQDKKVVNLTFDHVDKDEGVALQVFHTGAWDGDLEVKGKIKGAVIHRVKYRSWAQLSEQGKFLLWFYLCIGLFFAIQEWWNAASRWTEGSEVPALNIVEAVIVSLACTLIAIRIVRLMRPPFPKCFDQFMQ